MNKTLLIILGLAVAIGVAFFALTAVRPTPTPAPTPVAVLVPSATTTTPATTPAAVETPPVTPQAPAVAPPVEPSAVIARANGTPITQEALDEGVNSILAQYKNIYAQMGQNFQTLLEGPSGFSLQLGVQAQALERLVFTAIADAEVAQRGLAVSEEELSAEFDTQYEGFLASQGLTEERLSELLASQNMTLESFKQSGRESIQNQLLMMKLQADVAGPVELTEDEIAAYWEENKLNYETEEEVRASHILVKTEDEAKAILADLEAGGDFAQIAREKSTDTASARQDGDLGWFGRGTMVAEFEDAAFALEEGQRSGIVQTQYGYHILLLTGRKAAARPGLDEVRDAVVADAKEAVVAERANAWYAEVMAAADVSVEDPLLNAARLQRINVDLGLEAYESLWQAGTVDEPYLPYIVGTLYENRVQNLTRTKTQLEAAEAPDAAEIAEVAAQIAEAQAKAVAAYRDAVARSGGDAEIQARLDALLAPPTSSTTSPAAPQSAPETPAP